MLCVCNLLLVKVWLVVEIIKLCLMVICELLS